MSGGRRAARFSNDVTLPRRRPRVSPCCERIFPFFRSLSLFLLPAGPGRRNARAILARRKLPRRARRASSYLFVNGVFSPTTSREHSGPVRGPGRRDVQEFASRSTVQSPINCIMVVFAIRLKLQLTALVT